MGNIRIDIHFEYGDDGLPCMYQASVKTVADRANGQEPLVEIPGGFGEGKTLNTAVQAALRNMRKSMGGR